MSGATCVDFSSYTEAVSLAMESVGADAVLASQTHVLLKPNLVNASPFPVTTPPEFVRAVIDFIRVCTDAEILIAEGCGDACRETDEIFSALGYDVLARETGVPLLDLNHAPLAHRKNPACTVFPEMYLPEVAFTHFIVSLPVLKAHSLAEMTGTLKNMMGFAPPFHYAGGGSWKKAAFHSRMQTSIKDLCSYISPDLTVMDATVGLAEYHLGGATCDPPVGKIVAGKDPLACDRMAAGLLGLDWQTIGHLCDQGCRNR